METGENRTPRPEEDRLGLTTSLAGLLGVLSRGRRAGGLPGDQPIVLGDAYRRKRRSTPTLRR